MTIADRIASIALPRRAEGRQDLASRLDGVLERLDTIEAKLQSDEQDQHHLRQSTRVLGNPPRPCLLAEYDATNPQ
jgi:hypothetical protein